MQIARLRSIDDRFLWFGYILIPEHAKSFGISEPQARIDLKTYRELASGTDEKTRPGPSATRMPGTYFRPEPFSPLFTGERHIDDLVNSPIFRDALGGRLFVATSLAPRRRVDPDAVRAVLGAGEQGICCTISYQSLTTDCGRLRVISPHAFVKASGRWHVRAYDYDRRRFADFSLSRIRASSYAEESPSVPSHLDDEWRETIDLTILPHPDLSLAQQRVIRAEYGMSRKGLTLTVRRAVLLYLLDELRLLNALRENDLTLALGVGLWVGDVQKMRAALNSIIPLVRTHSETRIEAGT